MRPGGRVQRGPSRRLLLLASLLSARSASTSPASFDINVAASFNLVSFNVVTPGGMSVASVLGHLDPLDPGPARDRAGRLALKRPYHAYISSPAHAIK